MIVIKNIFAYLLVNGLKFIENRSRCTGHTQKWIALRSSIFDADNMESVGLIKKIIQMHAKWFVRNYPTHGNPEKINLRAVLDDMKLFSGNKIIGFVKFSRCFKKDEIREALKVDKLHTNFPGHKTKQWKSFWEVSEVIKLEKKDYVSCKFGNVMIIDIANIQNYKKKSREEKLMAQKMDTALKKLLLSYLNTKHHKKY